jgi:hypothetical protein
MSRNLLHGSVEWALMVALVLGTGVIAQAQAEEGEPQGPVVQIGEADAGTTTPGVEPRDAQGIEQPAAPKFWIGLGVGEISPDHVLRAFVEIPENQGLLVGTVAPDSPAAKAGFKQHDILLRANDIDLKKLADLTDLVSSEGATKKQIAVEVLRKSGRETVYVTPEDRPAVAQRPLFGNDDSMDFRRNCWSIFKAARRWSFVTSSVHAADRASATFRKACRCRSPRRATSRRTSP